MAFRKNWKIKSFNSRPRNEVDGLPALPCLRSYPHFNSRPHEEVDRIRLFQTVESIISTHDLAKRSTRYLCRFSSSITFQLTTSRRGRRSSPLTSSCTQYFNSRPHEEVDRWSSSVSMVERLFQLTTSRRGRHVFLPKVDGRGIISTHDLTKRSTKVIAKNTFAIKFQLTTSRRGRQNNCRRTSHLCIISTHDLTKRSTSLWSNKSITPDPKGIGAC